MSRVLTLAVVAALILPVAALATLIGQQERRFANVEILNVAVRGIDPRDMLKGHYLIADLDLTWTRPPEHRGEGGLCVAPGPSINPSVRFVDGWRPGDRIDADCRLMIAGEGRPKDAIASARFIPDSLGGDNGGIRLFVPEERAAELERLIRGRHGAVTVDLGIRPTALPSSRRCVSTASGLAASTSACQSYDALRLILLVATREPQLSCSVGQSSSK